MAGLATVSLLTDGNYTVACCFDLWLRSIVKKQQGKRTAENVNR
jgi:hypothetical protein